MRIRSVRKKIPRRSRGLGKRKLVVSAITSFPVSSDSIERALRDLPSNGQLIKDRPYRQVWRLLIEDRAYYLKFYPRRGGRLKRLFLGNPALREFSRLQTLQKARIPAPHAVRVLEGFRINEQVGDAVLMDAIEPGVTLDRYFNELELSENSDPLRREIAAQMVDVVRQLIRAGLGHRDLHLGNFLLSEGKIYLLDAYALRKNGMRQSDLLMLGHSVRRYATKTELLRAWYKIGHGKLPSANNRIARKFWWKEMSRTERENAYFGNLRADEWRGFYFKSRKYPVAWSAVSRLRISESDWFHEWPRLLGQLQSQQLRIIDDSNRKQVLAGEIVLAGVPLNVIVKRLRKLWYEYFFDIGFGSRSGRIWKRAWSLVVRDVPAAWPILVMERRRFGIVVDQIIVLEQIPGLSLSQFPLDDLTRNQRDQLFSRLGRLLRRWEKLGLYHPNAEVSKFVIQNNSAQGPMPILIDADGIRKIGWMQSSIHRLLDSLRKEQKAYNPDDSYALCRGYAPTARMEKEA
jgi:tRNA A-37 threonylcarbamoyl transferase component Bud32